MSDRPRVVLFDIDNTLLRGGGLGRRAFERALVEVTRTKAPLPHVSMAGRTDPLILLDFLAAMGIAPEERLLAAVMDRYVENLTSELRENRTSLLLPGALDVLGALSDAPDVHVGLLTGNIARGAALKLRAHGLDGRFAFGAYGDDARTRPELLPIALARWRAWQCQLAGATGGVGVRMEDVHVVGDTVHDVGVARAHGACAVAVGTGTPYQDREAILATRPNWFFETLADAGPWVERVRA